MREVKYLSNRELMKEMLDFITNRLKLAKALRLVDLRQEMLKRMDFMV